MTAPLPSLPTTRRHRLAAVLIGLVVPAGAFGYGALLGVAALALIAGLAVPDRAVHARRVLLTALFHPLGQLAVLMFALWLASLHASPVRLETAKTWVRVVLVVAGTLYLWSILDRNPTLSGLARQSLVASAAAVLALSVIAIVFFPHVVAALRQHPEQSVWFRYKAFASAAACMVPILLWQAWSVSGWRRIAALLAVVLACVVVFGSDSRAAVAGLAAAALVALFATALRQPRLRLPVAIAAAVLIVGVIAFLYSFFVHCAAGEAGRFCADPDTLGALDLPYWLVDPHRQNIWAFVLERVPERLWFGHGLNAIPFIPGADHLVPGMGAAAFVPSHPHNWAIEILAEAGIAGFVPAVLLLLSLIGRDVAAIARGGDARIVARLTVTVAFWVSAGFNFSIWAPWWHTGFLFLYLIVSARPPMGTEPKPRMLFSIPAEPSFLAQHLAVGRAARDAGFAVGVVTAVKPGSPSIAALGYEVHPLNIGKSRLNPLHEFAILNFLRRTYESREAALVHHISLRPVVYGGIAAQLAGVPLVVNALSGGDVHAVGGKSLRRQLSRLMLHLALGHRNARLFAQNPDDAKAFARAGIVRKSQVVVIPGSGVDIEKFHPTPEPGGEVVVAAVSTMLTDKGIAELVEAGRILAARGTPVRIRLVGDTDPDSPNAIHPATLSLWNAEPFAVWEGARSDIPKVWETSHIAALPSYREGVPRSLIEAAACGRPLIAADVAGSRSLVVDGENGFLVPVKNAAAIADAIAKLAADPDLRRRMGEAARRKVEAEFADPVIEARVAELYRGMLAAEEPA